MNQTIDNNPQDDVNDTQINTVNIVKTSRFKIIVTSVAGVIILVGILFFSIQTLRDVKLQSNHLLVDKITTLQISGKLENVTAKMIKTAIQHLLTRDFLDLDLLKIRQTIINFPWAKEVAVHKIYPNILAIRVTEQQAVAIWNQDAYLNPWGDIFKPKKITKTDLITLKGVNPKKILRLYVILKDMIGKSQLQSLLQNENGIYRIHLTNGIKVVLGRKHLEQRIGRLSLLLNVLNLHLEQISTIDLRYRKGIALKLKEQSRNV